ncbi:unnamed protein product [Rotaria sp. Silwood1]|nr:unnamed protein product [Rotaria sp. Silwood1]CAF1308976.1 unnamed protein product [Rotaria sp. Silwood1]CAF3973866.1 unnamed protein product [Rotaria sp. Silwood1]CAF5157002.1 unnamed protein product [Rotaria sp. Silwood1]
MSEFNKAERYAKWMIQQFPKSDIRNGDVYNLLSLICKDANKRKESVESYEKALDIYSYVDYDNSPRVIVTHCSHGLTHLALDDSRTADGEQRLAEEKFDSLSNKNLLLEPKVGGINAKLVAEDG